MSRARLIQLASVKPLRDAASAWDDLWQRSDVTTPTVRAELVAQWLEQFSPRGDFRVLAVEDQGQWVAALPLVQSPNSGLLRTARLTSNEWSASGDLLLDPGAAVDAVLDRLVEAMRKVPWRMLWLNEVPLEAPRWKALQRAIDRAGVVSDCHAQTDVGLIEIGDDWEVFRRSLSKKHRAKMARCGRRLAEKGDVRLEVLWQPCADQLEHRLRSAFAIEDRSWKGELGTSVLRSPGMFGFFVRQARQLAEWGQLELAFLWSGETPIAFSYGYAAKGVSHWHKIGYDPEYASCTPGQLLQWRLLEQYHAEKHRRAVDTMGPLTDALARWNPAPYRVGRMAIATRGLVGRPLLVVGKRSMPLVRRLRGLAANGSPCGKRERKRKPPGRGRIVGNPRGTRSSKFRRGQTVEVRSRSEILATLDADGKLEGLPFGPEMLKFCGRTFRVSRRAEKVFLDHHYYVAKLDNTVLLEGPRCDGRAHGGCQMRCLILWKEAWLKPAGEKEAGEKPAGTVLETNHVNPFLHAGEPRYCCQATELAHATRRLAWWDVRQYVRDLVSGEMTIGRVARMCMLLVSNKLRRMLGRRPRGEVRGTQTRTPAVSLNLQPGDRVEVKSKPEIEATLDANGKNRGLGFGGSMVAFCGKRYQVAGRVDKLILEWSGRMRKLTGTVILENVVCDGLDKRGCPRGCYHLWREIWLKRVPQPSCPPAADAGDVAESPAGSACVTGREPMEFSPPVGEAS